MNRNLDCCYFRVERDGKWVNLCFTDLTRNEQDAIMDEKTEKGLKSLCLHLADRLRTIGDTLDIQFEE